MEDPRKNILIIEDEQSVLKTLGDALTGAGFTTLDAKDGEQGLKIALGSKPDLILLDILMPKVDGITMLKRLREDPWGKNVPVIILTNVNPDSNAAINAVVDTQPAYYLIKSDIKLEDVIEKVKQVLKLEKPPTSLG